MWHFHDRQSETDLDVFIDHLSFFVFFFYIVVGADKALEQSRE